MHGQSWAGSPIFPPPCFALCSSSHLSSWDAPKRCVLLSTARFGTQNAAALCHLPTPRPPQHNDPIRSPSREDPPRSEGPTKQHNQCLGDAGRAGRAALPPGASAALRIPPASQRLRAPALLLPKNQGNPQQAIHYAGTKCSKQGLFAASSKRRMRGWH